MNSSSSQSVIGLLYIHILGYLDKMMTTTVNQVTDKVIRNKLNCFHRTAKWINEWRNNIRNRTFNRFRPVFTLQWVTECRLFNSKWMYVYSWSCLVLVKMIQAVWAYIIRRWRRLTINSIIRLHRKVYTLISWLNFRVTRIYGHVTQA